MPPRGRARGVAEALEDGRELVLAVLGGVEDELLDLLAGDVPRGVGVHGPPQDAEVAPRQLERRPPPGQQKREIWSTLPGPYLDRFEHSSWLVFGRAIMSPSEVKALRFSRELLRDRSN